LLQSPHLWCKLVESFTGNTSLISPYQNGDLIFILATNIC